MLQLLPNSERGRKCLCPVLLAPLLRAAAATQVSKMCAVRRHGPFPTLDGHPRVVEPLRRMAEALVTPGERLALAVSLL